MSETEYLPIADAAVRIGRSRRRVYEYLEIADARGSPIRRLRIDGRTFVNVPDLLEFEASVPPPGRPRKDRS